MKSLVLVFLLFSISQSASFDMKDQYSVQSIDYENQVLLEEETPEGKARLLDLKNKAIAQRQDELLDSNKAIHIKSTNEVKQTLRVGYMISSSSADSTISEVEDTFNSSDKVIVMAKSGDEFDFYFLKQVNTKRMKLGMMLKDTRYSNGCQIDLIFNTSPMKRYGLAEGDIITKANGVKINKCNTFKSLASKSKALKIQYNRYGVLKEAVLPLR